MRIDHKKKILAIVAAFVALPGGCGTFEEVFEARIASSLQSAPRLLKMPTFSSSRSASCRAARNL